MAISSATLSGSCQGRMTAAAPTSTDEVIAATCAKTCKLFGTIE